MDKSQIIDLVKSYNLKNIYVYEVDFFESTCTVRLEGGLRGNGLFSYYLSQVQILINNLIQDLHLSNENIYLLNWSNDVINDIWYLEIEISL